MSSNLMRYVRAIIGMAVLAAIAIVLSSWWGDYQSAQDRVARTDASLEASSTSTSTPSSLATGKGSGRVYTPATITSGTKVVLILIDGLHLRARPLSDAKSIHALKKGESLTLLRKKGGWYEVKSTKYGKGWISANPTYTSIKER